MGQALSIGIVARNAGSRNAVGLVVRIASGILLVSAALAIGTAAYMSHVPADLDTSTERLGDAGLYRVSYEPESGTIPVHEMHSWIVLITTPDGTPIEDASITVDGDMPRHGHGLPTVPQATAHLGGGRYRIDGMKFQMGGWWFVRFGVAAGGARDEVRFDFVLP